MNRQLTIKWAKQTHGSVDGQDGGALKPWLAEISANGPFRDLSAEIVPLDEPWLWCGELCGTVNSADVIDASVMIFAGQWRDLSLPVHASR